MELVQVSCLKGRINRVRGGETPVVELHLEPHQRIVSFELRPIIDNSDRVTVDWVWKAAIESRL